MQHQCNIMNRYHIREPYERISVSLNLLRVSEINNTTTVLISSLSVFCRRRLVYHAHSVVTTYDAYQTFDVAIVIFVLSCKRQIKGTEHCLCSRHHPVIFDQCEPFVFYL